MLVMGAIHIPYSRGHKRNAYKYEFGDFWGVRLLLNVFSHSVTLNLQIRQGQTREGGAYNRRCAYDRKNTVLIQRCPQWISKT